MPKASKMSVLFVSAEVAPFAKVGGLADVAAGLPKALKKNGTDVRIIMPAYGMIVNDPQFKVKNLFEFDLTINPQWTERVYVKQINLTPTIPIYLIGSENWFNTVSQSDEIYQLEPEPYIFFNRAVAAFIEKFASEWTPQIVHCNDWHTGLLPVYIRTLNNGVFENLTTVFTVHNLSYQGIFDAEVLETAGLPWDVFNFDQMEFFGKVNFLKGGLTFSDFVNTVSPTYAKEIRTAERGEGLDGLMQYLFDQGRLRGILNGIDEEEWNPGADKAITAKYTASNLSGKAKNKRALQAACGWQTDPNTVVIGMVTRMTSQKGFDLIKSAFAKILRLPVQIVLLGSGDSEFERYFNTLHRRHREKAHTTLGFNDEWARQIYAGADLFLMPSQFEPCGLGQLISLRYGTIPIVHQTGGLTDTITDFNNRTGKGNGFVFTDYTPTALFHAVQRAVDTFEETDNWQALVARVMNQDFSWNTSAQEYAEFYREAVALRRVFIPALV